MAGTAQDLLNAARADLGYSEGPRNGTKFGKWFGADHQAWCAMAVSMWAWEAGIPTSVIPKFAFTPAGEATMHGWGDAVPKAQARAGDIVFYRFPGMGRTSHVGVIESNLGGGYIIAIEGNTNGAGSRTGGSVLRKKRALTLVSSICRPKYSGTAANNTQEDDVLKDQNIHNPISGKDEPADVTLAYLEQRIVESLKKQLPGLVATAILDTQLPSVVDPKNTPKVRDLLRFIDRATNALAKKAGV